MWWPEVYDNGGKHVCVVLFLSQYRGALFSGIVQLNERHPKQGQIHLGNFYGAPKIFSLIACNLNGFWLFIPQVIVNLGSMNKVISFDEVSGILVSEAGCILESLVNFLDNNGFIMPLDLGSKGSCQIGGNVSTNAGGLRLIRYGSLHANVLGLEAVLANGDVLDMLGTLRKDNTGYDLKHLFIGSEGSLGIVTKVSILTPPKLSSVNVAFLACTDYLSCQKLLLEARRKLGEVLSAFEFLDEQAMDLALNHLEGVRNPLPPALHKFYVLIETTGSDERSEQLPTTVQHTTNTLPW
ncbi:D-2-hydroxyglutarate dehydrogenase, mitochondrial-like [Eucalyptus grandis]|uniref:D-2-hydroxyglutarate dehydrogenase, mitochondrial-like n=1 Tax=Eucalyptus grandis TaxID=71139 RepID=UPI00192EC100|nr:D-2-hydroxyglutarate dehydrogenase, mitochondrial-like [Eucalyptus grandis]